MACKRKKRFAFCRVLFLCLLQRGDTICTPFEAPARLRGQDEFERKGWYYAVFAERDDPHGHTI